VVGTNKEMAEILNAFFASIFNNENTDKLPPVIQQFHGSEQDKLCDSNIAPNTVKQKLYKLKNNKSPIVV